MRGHSHLRAALVATGMLAATAAMASNIEFWTWAPPPGGHDMWQNDAFRFLIRVRLYDTNAEPRQPGKDWNYYWPRDNVGEIAECIVDWYQYAIDPAQGYSGPVSLILQNFGYDMGDASNAPNLFRDTSDNFTNPSHKTDSNGYRWNVFFGNGKAEAADWVSGSFNFLQALQDEISSEGFADNGDDDIEFEYLHMDNETILDVGAATAGMNNNVSPPAEYGNAKAAYFTAAHWDVDEVLDGQTYKDLWEAGGSLMPDDNAPGAWWQPNWKFTNYLSGNYVMIMDEAMDDVLYTPFRTAFPGIKCGNYNFYLSSGANITASNPNQNPNPILGKAFLNSAVLPDGGQNVWHRMVIESLKADYSSRELYPAVYGCTRANWLTAWQNELKADPSITLTDAQIDAMQSPDMYRYLMGVSIRRLAQAAQAQDTEFIPWVAAPYSTDANVQYLTEDQYDDFKYILQTCRSNGVTKFIIWGLDASNTDDWDALNACMAAFNDNDQGDPDDLPVSSGGEGFTGNDWQDYGEYFDMPWRDSNGNNYITVVRSVKVAADNPNFDLSHARLSDNTPVPHRHFEATYGDTGWPTVADGDRYWDWVYRDHTGITRYTSCSTQTNSVSFGYDAYKDAYTVADYWVDLEDRALYTDELTVVAASGSNEHANAAILDRGDSDTLVWKFGPTQEYSAGVNNAYEIAWKAGMSGMYVWAHSGTPTNKAPDTDPDTADYITTFAIYRAP